MHAGRNGWDSFCFSGPAQLCSIPAERVQNGIKELGCVRHTGLEPSVLAKLGLRWLELRFVLAPSRPSRDQQENGAFSGPQLSQEDRLEITL